MRPRLPLRSALLAWALLALSPASAPAQAGSTPGERPVALVTGSTDGLGREVALRLARTGAHVIVHGRDAERGAAVVREIEAEGVGSARFHPADLASFDQVRGLAAEILREYDRLDLLVNNAGIALSERRVSEDGLELTFQVNYLSGYLLTRLLLPRLLESAPARIVNVSSRTQAPLDFDDPDMTRPGSQGRAYGRSKLAQIMLTFELARELEGTGVTVNAVHPAGRMDTRLVTDRGISPQSTVAEGAESVMHVVTAPDLGSGRYFHQKTPARAHEQAYDEAARRRLMELSARLTGMQGGR